jgi:glutamine amidotransferase
MKKVVVLDYGSGNLRSAQRALERVGADVTVTSDVAAAAEADGLVVPGVGAFAACMDGVRSVGMQSLFDAGVEHGVESDGLGVLPGRVAKLAAPILPHMGWNTVSAPERSTLFAGFADGTRFYFVHSYAVHDTDGLVTTAEHGERFVAAVERGAVSATQFHPEKSGDAGAALLENWLASV